MDEALEELIEEVRLSWQAMSRAAKRLQQREPLTLAMRAVLALLTRGGPGTVPQLAKRRDVSRQHVLTQVDLLAKRGLVELEDNPVHERSPIVYLTPAGRRLFERIQRREREFLLALPVEVSVRELKAATATLHRVRAALAGSP